VKKSTTFNLSYLLFAVFGVLLLHNLWVTMQTVAPIPYSDFQQHLKAKKVKEVVVTARDIRGEFTEPIEGKSRFVTTRVDKDLAALLEEHKVTFTGQVESALLETVLSWVVPILLFFVVWAFFARRMAERLGGPGGMLSIGKSKAKVYVETNFWLFRAARSAASLTRFARSAPEKPGVDRASTERSTSSASGILRV
jgi:cell division protease FtsH